MALPFFTALLHIAAIHVELRMILKSSRCTVYMLNQNMKIKTEDVGKQPKLSHISPPEIIFSPPKL